MELSDCFLFQTRSLVILYCSHSYEDEDTVVAFVDLKKTVLDRIE